MKQQGNDLYVLFRDLRFQMKEDPKSLPVASLNRHQPSLSSNKTIEGAAMSVYAITNTPNGWTITKDDYNIAGRYDSEDTALIALAFRQCEALASTSNNGLITETMVVNLIAHMVMRS